MDTFDFKILVEFSKCNSVSNTAKLLYVSQSSISKALNRIEAELGVPIFVHQKNKLILNENGEIAVASAKKILSQIEEMKNNVTENNLLIRNIKIGTCSPLAKVNTIKMCSSLFPNITINDEITQPKELIDGLIDGAYDFIVLPYKVNNKDIFTKYIFKERLCFTLPKKHLYAKEKEIRMTMLDGETVLVLSNMGFWINTIKNKMPNSKLIMVESLDDFFELTSSSTMPIFNSYESIETFGKPLNKNTIPISDEEAFVSYYFAILKKNKDKFENIFKNYICDFR